VVKKNIYLFNNTNFNFSSYKNVNRFNINGFSYIRNYSTFIDPSNKLTNQDTYSDSEVIKNES